MGADLFELRGKAACYSIELTILEKQKESARSSAAVKLSGEGLTGAAVPADRELMRQDRFFFEPALNPT